MRNKLLFVFFIAALLLFFNSAVSWITQNHLEEHSQSKHQNADRFPDPYTLLPKDYLNAVGWVSEPAVRKSHFLNFPETKEPGVIRIGAFGDSHTWGNESDDGFEYPALLQKMFRERGYPQVEVLNFGTGAHGFSQTYLTWKTLHKKYGIDFVLLGPGSFQRQRDLNFSMAYSDPWMIHSRYSLSSSGQLERIDIPGNNRQEIAKNYYSLFPSWQQWRYEARLPRMYIDPLITGAFEDFSWNPFYHAGSTISLMEEHRQLVKAMLDEMSRENQVLIYVNAEQKHSLLKSLPLPSSVRFIPPISHIGKKFPWWRHSHSGPVGNQRTAEIFFQLLTNSEKIRFEDFFLSGKIPAQKTEQEGPIPTSRGQITNIRASIDQFSIGSIWSIRRKEKFPVSIRNVVSGSAALLFFKSPDLPLVDSLILRVPDSLIVGEEVTLTTYHAQIKLGSIQGLDPHLPFFVLESSIFTPGNFDDLGENSRSITIPEDFAAKVKDHDKFQMKTPSGTIARGSFYVSSLDKKTHLRLTPRHLLFEFRPAKDFVFDLNKLPQNGRITLDVNFENSAEKYSLLAGEWKKQWQNVPAPIGEVLIPKKSKTLKNPFKTETNESHQ